MADAVVSLLARTPCSAAGQANTRVSSNRVSALLQIPHSHLQMPLSSHTCLRRMVAHFDDSDAQGVSVSSLPQVASATDSCHELCGICPIKCPSISSQRLANFVKARAPSLSLLSSHGSQAIAKYLSDSSAPRDRPDSCLLMFWKLTSQVGAFLRSRLARRESA